VTEIGDNTSDYTVTLPGRENEPIRLAWGAATDTGRRRAANEDSFVVRPPLFAVADGMGGHSAGDLASAAVVERLAELSGEEFISATDIERQLVAATEDIETVEGELGVGTTVTGAALTLHDDNPYFAVFNIGDSRVYRFERNELSQVTVDHSVVQELVDAGALTREEAEQHPDSNIITRAVGFNAEPMPDYWMVPIRVGVRLLICSDGLTKEVGDERIRLHLAAGLTPLATADALVDAALAAGGRDNVTTVVIDVIDAPSFTQNETADLDDTEPKLTR
jgi:PPM family protein phosphatase